MIENQTIPIEQEKGDSTRFLFLTLKVPLLFLFFQVPSSPFHMMRSGLSNGVPPGSVPASQANPSSPPDSMYPTAASQAPTTPSPSSTSSCSSFLAPAPSHLVAKAGFGYTQQNSLEDQGIDMAQVSVASRRKVKPSLASFSSGGKRRGHGIIVPDDRSK